jgi:hypothetical protein
MLYKETNWDRNTKNNIKLFYFIFKWKVLELSTSRTHGFFDRTFQLKKPHLNIRKPFIVLDKLILTCPL